MAKIWGWTYIHEGKPDAITRNGRAVLLLDPNLPSQHRWVLRVLRLLNKAEPGTRKRGR